ELEEALIQSDLGGPMTLQIIENLQQSKSRITATEIVQVARSYIEQTFPLTNSRLRPLPNRPKVILMVGVNGTGKTTSAAKLANLLKQDHHSAMLAATDTSLPPAIKQLQKSHDHRQVTVVTGETYT